MYDYRTWSIAWSPNSSLFATEVMNKFNFDKLTASRPHPGIFSKYHVHELIELNSFLIRIILVYKNVEKNLEDYVNFSIQIYEAKNCSRLLSTYCVSK